MPTSYDEQIKAIRKAVNDATVAQPRVTAVFPPCADVLLSLINRKRIPNDEATLAFREYFRFGKAPHVLGEEAAGKDDLWPKLGEQLDGKLLECAVHPKTAPAGEWPPECCMCAPCVALGGQRNPSPDPGSEAEGPITRLFVGDVLWLFYMDRMGLQQILGAILDAYAYNGRIPMSNGSLDPGMQDDLVSLVLEAMVRQVKMGLSSSVRDRTSLFRQVLGWSTEHGKKLGVESVVNDTFNSLFHKFISYALELYRDRRLAQAIKNAGDPDTYDPGRISLATVTALKETVQLLKRRLEPFHYGRNYNNALSGIVWTVASLSVVRELVPALGIPKTMNTADEYIPAAYDLLVMKRPVSTTESNRFLIHHDCATAGRDILIDIEVSEFSDDPSTPGKRYIVDWVNSIESKVEGYRSAYRLMTGVDLGQKAGVPTIEQTA